MHVLYSHYTVRQPTPGEPPPPPPPLQPQSSEKEVVAEQAVTVWARLTQEQRGPAPQATGAMHTVKTQCLRVSLLFWTGLPDS